MIRENKVKAQENKNYNEHVRLTLNLQQYAAHFLVLSTEVPGEQVTSTAITTPQ